MILSWIKRAVKAALNAAVDEWALEFGLSEKDVRKMRAERLARATEIEQRTDAAAVAALGVEEDDLDRPALVMSSAAQVTVPERCPAPGVDDPALMEWVHGQRESKSGWTDIAEAAKEVGHDLSEDALRGRYRRWRESNPGDDSANPSA